MMLNTSGLTSCIRLIGGLHLSCINARCIQTCASLHKKRRATHAGDILSNKFLRIASERVAKGSSGKMTPVPGSGVGTEFRVARLNKIFLQNITDILSTKDIASQLWEYGVTVSKVEITLSLSMCKVFWSSNHLYTNDHIQEMMKQLAGPIRDELQKAKLMSIIPSIVFIREEKNTFLAEIDKRLAVADLGEDFEPTDKTFYQRSSYVLQQEIDEDLWKKIESISKSINSGPKDNTVTDSNDENTTEESEDNRLLSSSSIPRMVNNVNHVPWDKIMDKIKHGVEQSKAIHRIEFFKEQPVRPTFESKRVSAPPTKNIQTLKHRLNKMKLRKDMENKKYKHKVEDVIYINEDCDTIDDYDDHDKDDSFEEDNV